MSVQNAANIRKEYPALLGIKKVETLDLLKEIERGFSFETFETLQKNLKLSREELADVVQISLRTLSRRKEGRLQPDESDRLLRISRIFALAIELFEGNVEDARRWMLSSQKALGNKTPFVMSKTEIGAREVENLIGRLEHGVFT